MRTIIALLVSIFPVYLFAQCNGDVSLCDKKFNEVSMVMTHNAFNAGNDGFNLPNQTFGVKRQLQDGVRGFMLDIYEVDGVIEVYHSFQFLGSRPLAEVMQDIKDFMDENPNEVLAIIYQSAVNPSLLESELTAGGLLPYLHKQILGEDWPTLQEMIDSGERLVIFSESDDGLPGQDWYHYAWAHTFDTDYSYAAPSEFHCGVNRGSIDNSLYLINHWITTPLGVGDSLQAATVNANPFLIDRLLQCQEETGRFPNFIGLDFYHIGDGLQAAAIMNGLISSNDPSLFHNRSWNISPNPGNEQIRITSDETEPLRASIFDVNGRLVFEQEFTGGLEFDASGWQQGVYFCTLTNISRKFSSQKRLLITH